MKIFLIGYSGLGKTTLAQILTQVLTQPYHIQAGGWVRQQCPPTASVQDLTQFAREELLIDPDVAVKYVKSCMNQLIDELNLRLADCSIILEGIRNPRDFIQLFDPKQDLVVFLRRKGIEPKSSFEEGGCAVIKQYIAWMLQESLINFDTYLDVYVTSTNSNSETASDENIPNLKIGEACHLTNSLEDVANLIAETIAVRTIKSLT